MNIDLKINRTSKGFSIVATAVFADGTVEAWPAERVYVSLADAEAALAKIVRDTHERVVL